MNANAFAKMPDRELDAFGDLLHAEEAARQHPGIFDLPEYHLIRLMSNDDKEKVWRLHDAECLRREKAKALANADRIEADELLSIATGEKPDRKQSIARTAARLIRLVELNAPEPIIKNEIELLQKWFNQGESK